MNTQHNNSDNELPLLTEMVNDSALDELPILTEVVTDGNDKATPPDSETLLAGHPNETCDFQTSAVQETVACESAVPRAFNPEEMQQLLQQLEIHLETVFTSRLNTQIEQLQRLAVDLAVSELKAELPQLLRDALNKTDVSR